MTTSTVPQINCIEHITENRAFYTFDRPCDLGGALIVELTRCFPDSLMHLWRMHGYIDHDLDDYWFVKTYAYDAEGCCFGRYNPQLRMEVQYNKYDPDKATVLPKMNFEWVLAATEENKIRILEEICRRAYKTA